MGGTDNLDAKVEAMEMEMLNPSSASSSSSPQTSFTQESMNSYMVFLKRRLESLLGIARLYYHMYPKPIAAVGGILTILVVRSILVRRTGKTVWTPPHLVNHFGDVQSYYDLQISKIDHWCFHGGDHDCACEDPTEPVDRENERYWMENHDKNKQKAYEAAEMGVDVVFLGDQFVQAWDGHFMNRRIVGADVIQTKFRETFSRAGGGLVDGLALGIAGDTTANLLWRIQNGEIPDNLNPKLWWIMIGANDLAITQCSEEAVVVGILRLADEIKIKFPEAVVVVQGILPRSSYSDGHLKSVTTEGDPGGDTPKKKEYFQIDHYPLWPSIQMINKEIEKFAAKHEHLVYYDASDIFFGSVGNEYFKTDNKVLIQELFKKDFATPSTKGFEILTKVIGKEVVSIVYDDDESNHKATKQEEGQQV